MPTLPPADHPVWKIVHSVIAVVGLYIVVAHGAGGTHDVDTVDLSDGAGVLGLGAALRFFWLITFSSK
jgi:hypothetical protein